MNPGCTQRPLLIALAAFILIAGSAKAAITIDTSKATDWQIGNGVISLDWNSTTGAVFGVHLVGHADNLVDLTHLSGNGQPSGLYMDNTGLGSGATSAGYQQAGNNYLDWWFTTASGSSNAFTFSQHFILADNDAGFHVYIAINHGSSDIAGSIGQIQYVFRISQTLFTNTYTMDEGLGRLGPLVVVLPTPDVMNTTDPGRQVQNAAVDLHGLPLPPTGFGREFFTKYDYSSYEYLHRAHGLFGDTYGAWTVIPSTESLVAGPTKQDLIFTENILMMECQSDHLNNGMAFNVEKGQVLQRLYGPFYFHFNAFDSSHGTADSLYLDALDAAGQALAFYDTDSTLLANGYVPSSGRGTVQLDISGAASSAPNTAWAVLADNQTNFQYSDVGRQYWADVSSGSASLTRVVPGAYRLSTYVLGQWGELRSDNITVSANQTATGALTFQPENFGSSPPVWTIGTPDRSAHEFLHGHNSSGMDDREYWGNWNYWADFAANAGAVIYYATAVGSTPATNDLSQWNYNQWQSFNPGLYGGIYNASDDTTDGYKYICPAYVGNCASARVPPWQVHFATTAAQQAQGQFAVLSVGLAATESGLTASLNGNALAWAGDGTKYSDATVRSGLSGTYQWVVFQWPTSQLSAPGADNVITLTVNSGQGLLYDALRMEITSSSANPAFTGWHDYDYVASGTSTPANDRVANNNGAGPIMLGPTLTAGTLANGATYMPGGLVPGSWAQVKGVNLSSTTRIWAPSDFTGLGQNLPTNLNGVQVMVDNLPAAVYYISPTQVSFQVPSGVSGTASVQVLNNGMASTTVTAAAAANSPGIFPVIANGTSYPAAVFLDGSYVGDPSIGPGFRNAHPGDIIQLYATGLVPTPAGVLPSPQAVSGVTVTIGNVTVPADSTTLVAAGEFQINFTVPQPFAAGQYPIAIQVNGVSSPPGLVVLPIQAQ
jgi:uncharacterized protein (TIGR03437 family)